MRMRMIILQLLCLRQQAFFEVYHELLCGIPLMHNDEDGTIILQSLCLQHQNAFVVYHDLLLGNTNARWTEGNHYVARIHTRFLILLYDDEEVTIIMRICYDIPFITQGRIRSSSTAIYWVIFSLDTANVPIPRFISIQDSSTVDGSNLQKNVLIFCTTRFGHRSTAFLR